MRILAIAIQVAAVLIGIWPLIVLNRWTKLDRGRTALLSWGPRGAISAQGAVALLWLFIILTLPWTFYTTYLVLGSSWFLPATLVLSLLVITIPGSLIILGAAWLRLHPIPPG